MLDVRPAQLSDLEEIVAIYNFEIEHGQSNYEQNLRQLKDQETWFKNLEQKNLPVLVATQEKKIVGFAALTPFHSLSGYRFTASAQLYVAADSRRSGVGLALAQKLQEKTRATELRTVLAGINSENTACIALLKSIGFEEVGRFKDIGFKNGRFHDDVCMQWMVK